MVTSQKDVLTRLKEAQQARSSSSSPFFFIKPGEKALVRCLREFDKMVPLVSHRKYDESLRRYEHYVCAEEFGHECGVCASAKARKDNKLAPQDIFYMPIFLHRKIDAAGLPREVGQLMYLEMGAWDGINAGLAALYAAEDGAKGAVTSADLIIQRVGEGSQSKYTVVARRTQPVALPADLVIPSDEKIRSDVELAHPMQIVETDDAPSPNPEIIAADPFKTVDEFDGF